VRALLENGADPRLRNKRGSTPLHLAVQNTGRSDSGAVAAKDQQRQIIGLLLQHGARPTDTDAKGKTVETAAASDWIRDLLV
jgi:ankyrin repeat protein